jgi:tetratricopeptide (TPR) repeat protein
MAAFELGNFREALEEYERAYQIAPLPGFLFNIGQCHRNLGNLKKAVFSFRHYLRKKPEARNREAVMTLIRELEARIEADRQRADSVPVYIRPKDPPPPKRPRRPVPVYQRGWFWPVLVTSILVVGGGAATGIYFGTRSKGPDLPTADFPPIDFSRK